jgi:hypothetical protein
MKRIFTLLTFFISILSVCTLSVVEGYGQLTGDNYPVQAHVYVQRPGLKMPEYFSSTTMLRTDLILKDLTKTTLDVYLGWQITGLGLGVEAGTLPGFVPPNYLTLTKGSKRQLGGAELREYFQPGMLAVSGVGENVIFNGKLPEGFYTIKITAYEAGTGRQVSNTAETFFSVAYALPPVINLPLIGSEQPVTRPQSVLLQWMPRHTATGSNRITYSGKVCEVAEDEDPNIAINGSQNCFTIPAQPGTSYVLKASDLPLKVGKRYAFQVQVTDNNEQLEFQNQGYSEVSWFRFGEACKPPSGLQVNAIAAGRLNVSWNANPQATGYKLLYRSENQTEWTEQTTLGTSVSLVSLNPELDYEFKVITVCEVGNESPESETVIWEGEGEVDEELEDLIKKVLNPLGEPIVSTGPGLETSFTPETLPETFEDLIPKDPTKIPCIDQVDSYENCSDVHPTIIVDQRGENPDLKVGDLVTIYDYIVVLTQISGGNPYSGKGLAQMPFLNNAKVPVEFSNVVIKQKDPAHKGGCVTEVNGYFRVRTGLTPEQIRQEEIDLIHEVRTNTDPGSIYISRGQVITELSEELTTTGKDLCDGKPITEEARQSLLKKHTLAKQGLQDWAEDAADLYSELDLDGTEVLSRIQAMITALEANIAIINSGEGCPGNPDIKAEMDAIKEKIKEDIEKSKEPTDNLPKITDVAVKNITESEATITWKGDKRFTKYLVSYQKPGEGLIIKEVTATEINLKSLGEETIYDFKISGMGENDIRYDHSERFFQTLAGVFPKPTNLMAEDVGADEIKITWDKNALHKKYKIRYVDSEGIEQFIYPTTNQTIIKGIKDNEIFEYEVYALNDEGTKSSFEKDSFASPNVCKNFKILGSSKLLQGESTKLKVSDRGLRSIRWMQGQRELSVTNELSVTPLVTTTYSVICEFETYNNTIVFCDDEITIEVLQACENVEIVHLTHDYEYKKPITLYAKGCVSDIEWHEGLNSSQILSTASIVEFYSDKDTYYSLKCKDNTGDICHAKTGQLSVGCEMQMAVSYNQYNNIILGWSDWKVSWEDIGGFSIPFNVLTFIPRSIASLINVIPFVGNGLSNNAKEATVVALGCPNKVSWDYDKGEEVESGDNYIKLEKVKDTDITATCKKSNGQINCTKTTEIEKPKNKCKEFKIIDEFTQDGLKLSVPNNSKISWGDTYNHENPRIFPYPKETTVYKVSTQDGKCTENYVFYITTPKENKDANLNPIECKPFFIKTSNGETTIIRGNTITLQHSGCEVGSAKGQVTWIAENIPANGVVKPMSDTDYSATCTIDGQTLTDCITIKVKEPVFELKVSSTSIVETQSVTLEALNCSTGFPNGNGIVDWYFKQPKNNINSWTVSPGNELKKTLPLLFDTYFKVICRLPGKEDQIKEVLIYVKEIPDPCKAYIHTEELTPQDGYTQEQLYAGVEFRISGCDYEVLYEFLDPYSRNLLTHKIPANNHDNGYKFKMSLPGLWSDNVRVGCKNSIGEFCWLRYFYMPVQRIVSQEAENVSNTSQLDGAPNNFPADFNKGCRYLEGSKTVNLGERGYDKFHYINLNDKNEPVGIYLKNDYCTDAGNANNKTKGKPYFFTESQRSSSSQVPFNSKTKESYHSKFPNSDVKFYGVCVYGKNEYCGFDVTIKYQKQPSPSGQSIKLTESDLALLESFSKIDYSEAQTEGCPDTKNCGFTNARKTVKHILKELLCEKFHYFIGPNATDQQKLDKMNYLLTYLENSPALSSLNLDFPEVTLEQMKSWTGSDMWCNLGMDILADAVPETVLKTSDVNEGILNEKLLEDIFNSEVTEKLIIEVEQEYATCSPSSGNTLTINASNGYTPFEYSIDNGENFFLNQKTFENLPYGTYQIIVRDSRGSTGSKEVTFEPVATEYLISNARISAMAQARAGTSPEGKIECMVQFDSPYRTTRICLEEWITGSFDPQSQLLTITGFRDNNPELQKYTGTYYATFNPDKNTFYNFYRKDFYDGAVSPTPCTASKGLSKGDIAACATCAEGWLPEDFFNRECGIRPKELVPAGLTQLLAKMIQQNTHEETYGNARLKIFKSDPATTVLQRNEIVDQLSALQPNDIALWIDVHADGSVKYEFFTGSNYTLNQRQKSLFNQWVEAIDPFIPQLGANPFVAILEGVADMAKEYTVVPPKYWDCNHADYYRLPWITECTNCLTPANWALLCGVWEGVVNEATGLVEFVAILADNQKRNEMLSSLKGLMSAETWSAMWDELEKKHTDKADKPCQLSHQIGQDITAVGSLVLPITKLSKAQIVASVANLADNVVLGLSKFKTLAVNTFEIVNNTGKAATTISNIAGKIRVNIADELCVIADEFKRVDLFGTGQGWALQTTDGINFSATLGDQILYAKNLVQDGSGKILATIKKGGDDVLVVIKGSYKSLDDIWRLHPNLRAFFDDLPAAARTDLEKLTPNTLKKLLDRLSANPELAATVKTNPQLTRLWTAHKADYTPAQLAEAEDLFSGLVEELTDNARNLAIDLAEESNKKARMLSIFDTGKRLGDNIKAAMLAKNTRLFDLLEKQLGIPRSELIKYEILSEVPLNTSGGFMKADVMLVRRSATGEFLDIILIENKLNAGSPFTVRQKEGFGAIINGQTNMNVNYTIHGITPEMSIPVSSQKIFKMYDHGTDDILKVDIIKITSTN